MVEPTTTAVALAIAELSKMITELATLIWNPSVQKLRKEVKNLKHKEKACYVAGEYMHLNDELRDALTELTNGEVFNEDRRKALKKIMREQSDLYEDFRKLTVT